MDRSILDFKDMDSGGTIKFSRLKWYIELDSDGAIKFNRLKRYIEVAEFMTRY